MNYGNLSEQLQVRLTKELSQALEFAASRAGADKATFVRQLISKAVASPRISAWVIERKKADIETTRKALGMVPELQIEVLGYLDPRAQSLEVYLYARQQGGQYAGPLSPQVNNIYNYLAHPEEYFLLTKGGVFEIAQLIPYEYRDSINYHAILSAYKV